MKTISLIARVATTVIAAQTLDIATYSDKFCSVMGPTLVNTTSQCVTSPSGFSSLELYSLPSDGSVTLYSGANCTGETRGINLMYRGCFKLYDFVARSADFCG